MRNGTGGYQLPANSFNPAVNGVAATAADWNSTAQDIQAAIQQSVSSDGQTPMTGNLNMNGNKITGLANASASGDAVSLGRLDETDGASLIGFLPAGTGAVPRDVEDKLRESPSVVDQGADPTSTTNSTTAFSKARAITNRYFIPSGTYTLDASPDPFLDCFTSGNGVTLIVGGVSYDCSNAFAGPLRYVAASATKTNIVHAKTGNVVMYFQDGGPGTATGFYRGLAVTTDSHALQMQPGTNGGSTDLLFQRSVANPDSAGNRFNVTFEEGADRLMFNYATTAAGSPAFDSFMRSWGGTSPLLDFPAVAPTFRQGWSMQNRAETGYKMSFVVGADRHHIKDFAGTFTHMTFKADGSVGFFGAGGVTRPTITGSRGGNSALTSLLTALGQLGLIDNSTTA